MPRLHHIDRRHRLVRDRRRHSICAVLLVGLLASGTAAATPIDADPAGWRQFTPGGKRAAAFTAQPDGALQVEASGAVSFLYRELPALPGAGARLAWRWRVDATPEATQLDRAGMDDRPLALHVWFPKPASRRGFWDGVKSALGLPVTGAAITYVWGGLGPRGQIVANPHHPDGVLIVLRSGAAPTGQWFVEQADVVADYRRAFGRLPEAAPRYIAISADTDDKGGTAVSRIAGLRLEPAADAAAR